MPSVTPQDRTGDGGNPYEPGGEVYYPGCFRDSTEIIRSRP